MSHENAALIHPHSISQVEQGTNDCIKCRSLQVSPIGLLGEVVITLVHTTHSENFRYLFLNYSIISEIHSMNNY